MFINTNYKKNLSVLFKILFLILGLNICLTSVFVIIKKEFTMNNSELGINLIIKKLKDDKNNQFYRDIY